MNELLMVPRAATEPHRGWLNLLGPAQPLLLLPLRKLHPPLPGDPRRAPCQPPWRPSCAGLRRHRSGWRPLPRCFGRCSQSFHHCAHIGSRCCYQCCCRPNLAQRRSRCSWLPHSQPCCCNCRRRRQQHCTQHQSHGWRGQRGRRHGPRLGLRPGKRPGQLGPACRCAKPAGAGP